MSDVNFYAHTRQARLHIPEKVALPEATREQVEAWERIEALQAIQRALQELPCRLKQSRFVSLQSAIQRACDEARMDLPRPDAIFPHPPRGGAEFLQQAAEAEARRSKCLGAQEPA